MNVTQAARRMGLSRVRLYQLIDEGKIKAERCPCGHGWMIESLGRVSKSRGRPRTKSTSSLAAEQPVVDPADAQPADTLMSEKISAEQTEPIDIAPDSAAAWNARAWLLATSPDAEVRDGAKAVEAAKRAMALDPKKGFYPATLAAAYAEAGDFEQAVRCQQEAMQRVPRLKFDPEARRRLKLYRQGQPYREDPPSPERHVEPAKSEHDKPARRLSYAPPPDWRQ